MPFSVLAGCEFFLSLHPLSYTKLSCFSDASNLPHLYKLPGVCVLGYTIPQMTVNYHSDIRLQLFLVMQSSLFRIGDSFVANAKYLDNTQWSCRQCFSPTNPHYLPILFLLIPLIHPYQSTFYQTKIVAFPHGILWSMVARIGLRSEPIIARYSTREWVKMACQSSLANARSSRHQTISELRHPHHDNVVPKHENSNKPQFKIIVLTIKWLESGWVP